MPEDLVVRVDADLHDLVPRYLENRRKDVQTITEALARGDFDLIWTLSHNMKGTGKCYGMAALTSMGHALAGAAKARDGEAVQTNLDVLCTYLDRVEVVCTQGTSR
jgi:HPt (histidine-containing phosphotransfer) domain-containing protein